MMEALEEHRGVEALGHAEGHHVGLHHGDTSRTLAPVLDEAAELLVELHRGDVEPRRHHVLRQVPPSGAELDDTPRPGAATTRPRPGIRGDGHGRPGHDPRAPVNRSHRGTGAPGRPIGRTARSRWPCRSRRGPKCDDRAPTSTPGRPPRRGRPAVASAARARSRRAGRVPRRRRCPSAWWPGPVRRRGRRRRRAASGLPGAARTAAGVLEGGRRPPGRRSAPARDWTDPMGA